MAVLKLSSPTLPERSNINTRSSDTSHTVKKMAGKRMGGRRENERKKSGREGKGHLCE